MSSKLLAFTSFFLLVFSLAVTSTDIFVTEDLTRNIIRWDLKAEMGIINYVDVDKRDEWIMKLNEENHSRPWFSIPLFRKLAIQDASLLESRISMEEVKEAVCIVANELIHMAHIECYNLLLFKVDFEKAFDSVNWIFLFDTMRQCGFDENGLGGFGLVYLRP
ncbi:hypothetical protein Tco_0196220 [Tanacetum coccineum]